MTVPVLVKVVEEFFSLADEISTIATRREFDTTGETLAKNEARKDLAHHASKLAACGMAYAYDRSDPELEAYPKKVRTIPRRSPATDIPN